MKASHAQGDLCSLYMACLAFLGNGSHVNSIRMVNERVLITDNAKKIIDRLRKEHGNLIFHQSGGCCDGSSPMCFIEGEFLLDEGDIYLGSIYKCPFYMSADQFEYWKHTELTIDIVQGRGASFSLEIPLGLRFITKSRIFTDEELSLLPEALPYQGG